MSEHLFQETKGSTKGNPLSGGPWIMVREKYNYRKSNNNNNPFLTAAYQPWFVSKVFEYVFLKEDFTNHSDELISLYRCLVESVYDLRLINQWIAGFMRNSLYSYKKVRMMKNYAKIHIQHIYFCPGDVLEKNVIISESLECHGYYDKPLEKDVFPSGLRKLKLWKDFNQILKEGDLPDSLTSLTFGEKFNPFDLASMVGSLPRGLTKLKFGRMFNCPLNPDFLPSSLVSLCFGDQYDQPLCEHSLPQGLKFLYFGERFNQLVKPNVLPQGLEKLRFGFRFNQLLERGVIPEKLLVLIFGGCFNQLLDGGILSGGLFKLIVGVNFDAGNLTKYPPSLKWFVHYEESKTIVKKLRD